MFAAPDITVCVCVYVCVCVCVCVYLYMCICICICMHMLSPAFIVSALMMGCLQSGIVVRHTGQQAGDTI